MKKYFLILPFFLFFTSAFTQDILKQGYIVLNSKDTLRCEIVTDPDEELRERVRVRQKGSVEYVIYTPDKLQTFFYEKSNLFESVTVEGGSFFLRCLVRGHFSLYSFPSVSNSSSYYLKKDDGTLVKLVNTLTNVEVGDSKYKKLGYEYIVSLKLAMKDHPELSKSIDKAKMDDESLAGIVMQYNIAKDPKTGSTQFSKKGKPILDLGVLVGYSKYIGFSTQGGVRVGMLASLRSGKDKTRFRYNMGLFYNKADYETPKKGQYTVELPLYISFYPITNKKITPYFNFGLMPSYYSGYDAYEKSYSYSHVSLMTGTGIDIKLKKKSYMKVDITIAGGFVSAALGYMF